MAFWHRITRAAALIGGTMLVSGCFFQPGTFDATMHVMADGRFSFSYEGEIVMSGMEDMVAMAEQAGGEDMPDPCYDEETFEERDCTEAELADRAAQEERDKAMMAAMFGGVDVSDPEAAAQLAQTIERQAGWDRVEYVDKGVFSVSFSLTSRMGHDFDFPTLEGVPVGNSFVAARLRDANRLRIEAKGFSAQQAANPFSAMMMGMASSMAQAGAEDETSRNQDEAPAQFAHPMRGTFRLITDARILANNTDEGPTDTPEGQILEWAIDADTAAPPTALLELNP